MRTFMLLLPMVLLTSCVSVLQADTILVPSQQPTIQAGIDVAVDGDTVLVADGTYTGDGNRDIDFLGKAIVVMSENGAESCVIDCEGSMEDQHRGFYFHAGEDSSSMVKGFTIANGYRYSGGGIYCLDSSPTIMDNTIMGNTAFGSYESGGGGISCYNSSPIIAGNTISGNSSDDDGGGIYCNGSYSIIQGNTISENEAGWSGSGIYCAGGSPIIQGNTITGNLGGLFGGGIYCYWSSSPIIKNNTITWNEAHYGGGIYCGLSSPSTITGNTISRNWARFRGGGIYCGSTSHPIITNSILWGDSPHEIFIESGDPVVTYSNVQGGWPGEGNINEDPMFVQPDTLLYTDYRLLWESPCIDTGDPTLFDPDGTRSDMGAHYFNQNDYLTLYITPDTTEVSPGEQLGVTYTAINRWAQPEPFWVLSQVTLPGGNTGDVVGPYQYNMPADTTIQVNLFHDIPVIAPTGMYEYRSLIGLPPGTLYDEDSFKFGVIE